MHLRKLCKIKLAFVFSFLLLSLAPQTNASHLDTLPPELLLHALSFAPYQNVLRYSQTNRIARDFFSNVSKLGSQSLAQALRKSSQYTVTLNDGSIRYVEEVVYKQEMFRIKHFNHENAFYHCMALLSSYYANLWPQETQAALLEKRPPTYLALFSLLARWKLDLLFMSKTFPKERRELLRHAYSLFYSWAAYLIATGLAAHKAARLSFSLESCLLAASAQIAIHAYAWAAPNSLFAATNRLEAIVEASHGSISSLEVAFNRAQEAAGLAPTQAEHIFNLTSGSADMLPLLNLEAGPLASSLNKIAYDSSQELKHRHLLNLISSEHAYRTAERRSYLVFLARPRQDWEEIYAASWESLTQPPLDRGIFSSAPAWQLFKTTQLGNLSPTESALWAPCLSVLDQIMAYTANDEK